MLESGFAPESVKSCSLNSVLWVILSIPKPAAHPHVINQSIRSFLFPTERPCVTRAGAPRPTTEFLSLAAGGSLVNGPWAGERVISVISSQRRGGRVACPGAPDPAKLPLQSWPYFKSNSKIQLSELVIPSPKKPGILPQGPDVLLTTEGPSHLALLGARWGGRGWAQAPRDSPPQGLLIALGLGSSPARFLCRNKKMANCEPQMLAKSLGFACSLISVKVLPPAGSVS